VASERLALTASGQVRYTLKTPYRDGTTHIVLEPLDLMARLAALVPKPRSLCSHAASSGNPRVMVEKVLTSARRFSLPSLGWRTHATTVSLCTSRPAHRSNTISISTSL
jgi:hypothetical protein